MSATSWAKFFWADWASDEALRLSSLAAQGLWMRMLCVAANHNPIGYVAVNGRSLGVTDIARIAGVTETECESLLQELDRNGVFSRAANGMIFSRRMIRDAKRSAANSRNGRKGGNPALKPSSVESEIGNSHSLKPPLNPEHKPQKPEARSQNSYVGLSAGAGASVPRETHPLTDDLEPQLRQAAGWENHPAPNLFVTGPIEALISAGCDLVLDVLPVIRRDAPRCRSPNWKFFTAAIAQARDDRIAAGNLKFEARPNAQTAHKPNSIASSFAIVNAAIAEQERREAEAGLGQYPEDAESLPRLRQIPA